VNQTNAESSAALGAIMSSNEQESGGSMRGKGLLIAVVVLVALIGAAMFFGRDTWATAKIGTVYVAKQTCSCLFVAGRPLDSCRTDYDPAALKPLTVETTDSGVKVSALAGLVSAQAKFEPGFGCHPAN
jgi:hypothetical protein